MNLTPSQSPNTKSLSLLHFPFSLHLALFLFLLAVYMLTYTPRINSSDGLAMFATAESLVRRGTLDIEQIRWMNLQQGTYGLDGLLYSRKGIGVPLGLLPLTALGLALPWFGPVSAGLLFNAVVTALTGVLLLVYLQALGFSTRVGLLTGLAFGLATLAWPYAKSLFSDPFSGLLLLAAALALLKFRHTAQSRWTFLAGLLLGWNVATRYAEAIFLPVFGLLLLYYGFTIYNLKFTINPSQFRIHNSQFAIPILAFAAPVLAVGLSLMAFNLSRYGDPLNTGYLPTETFSAIWLDGIAGQLISPGRGLLLFSPILILSLGGFFPFVRYHCAEALLALSIILIHLLLYGKWFMWHGGYAWGPRFLVPTLPFWTLLLAPAIRFTIYDLRFTIKNHATRITYYALRIIVPLLFALSVLIQIPLLLVDFSTYMAWLLESGLPLFARETFFEWAYSPWSAVGQFMSMGTLDVAWAWGESINRVLLAALLANMVVCGVSLQIASSEWRVMSNQLTNQPTNSLTITSIFTTLTALLLLLSHAHTLPPDEVQQTVDALNRDISRADTVITNGPELSEPFAERYAGRAPVLGLNSSGPPLATDIERRLNETIAAHQQVWWLPNGLSPEESAVEQTLSATMVRVRNESFGRQRLALFAAPPTGEASPQTGAIWRDYPAGKRRRAGQRLAGRGVYPGFALAGHHPYFRKLSRVCASGQQRW